MFKLTQYKWLCELIQNPVTFILNMCIYVCFLLFNMTYVYKTYIIYTTELQIGGQLLEQPKFKKIIVTIH